MVAAIIILATACERALLPVNTPVLHQEIKNESGQLILVGHQAISVLQEPNYTSWFMNSYNAYTVDSTTAIACKANLHNKSMTIFLGSWCGDSKREVPRMLKILETAGMDTHRVSLVFVDNSTNSYKQSPQHEEQNRNIHHVPTFIIYDGNKEMGRIIESPVISLEKDMQAILTHQPYTPNYKAISYWITKVTKRKSSLSGKELQNLAGIIKPLCRHYGEFNAYGYVQLAANHNKEALNVFRLNTLMYPDTPGVFDSLGEAFAKTGDKTAAISAYEKVLQLNPGNENARKMLLDLKK